MSGSSASSASLTVSAATAGKLTHPDTGEEVRFDVADGNLHTLQGFVDFYGVNEGNVKWRTAPCTRAEWEHAVRADGVAPPSASSDDVDGLGLTSRRFDVAAAPTDAGAAGVGASSGHEITFDASELKAMMSGGMCVTCACYVRV
jgi:hypothetical protein